MTSRLGVTRVGRGMLICVLLAGCSDVAEQSPAAPSADVMHASVPAPVPMPVRAPVTQTMPAGAASVASGSIPVAISRATVSASDPVSARPTELRTSSKNAAQEPRRLVLIGDSIVDQLCAEFPDARCVAFPGGWVAAVDGTNLADQFVSQAQLRKNDIVVLSSIGGWHSPGVDDGEILRRLQVLYGRISSTVQRLVVLVPPYPNFDLCLDPSTPEALALLGQRHDELCHTQQLIADLERSWPVTEVPIIGPYISDEEHETPQARQDLARAVRFVLDADPHSVAG